jgi:26S proteasome regulatory subunit N6
LLGIDIIDSIIVDVRKADDKHLLLEIYLIESKLNFGKENYSKAKASLTAARACANAIYCPPF